MSLIQFDAYNKDGSNWTEPKKDVSGARDNTQGCEVGNPMHKSTARQRRGPHYRLPVWARGRNPVTVPNG